MQMEIKTRHFTLGDDQRATVEAALEKLEKFIPRPVQSFKINIDHDAGHFVAGGVLQLKNHEFRASGEAREPEYAVDEMFESLTLIQTGRMRPVPFLLFGRDFWERVINWQALADAGTISAEDLTLFRYVETAEEAAAIIDAFEPAC